MELWLMGLSGWVVYNLFLLQKNAKVFDLNKDGVLQLNEVGRYFSVNWLSILISLVLTLIIVGFELTEELFHASLGWMGYQDQAFIKAFYLSPALFSIVIQWGLTKATKSK